MKVGTEEEVRAELARVGLRLEDLRPFEFHTPEQVLKLTAIDVADNNTDEGGTGARARSAPIESGGFSSRQE